MKARPLKQNHSLENVDRDSCRDKCRYVVVVASFVRVIPGEMVSGRKQVHFRVW